MKIYKLKIPVKIYKQINKEGSFKIFEHKGLKCVIFRMPLLGFLNGYVAVPKGHPLFGKDIDDPKIKELDVHGGISYSDKYLRGYELPDKEELWWFGFDTAHAGDCIPFHPILGENETYRTIEYVTKEVIKLAEQLYQIQEDYGGKQMDLPAMQERDCNKNSER